MRIEINACRICKMQIALEWSSSFGAVLFSFERTSFLILVCASTHTQEKSCCTISSKKDFLSYVERPAAAAGGGNRYRGRTAGNMQVVCQQTHTASESVRYQFIDRACKCELKARRTAQISALF